MPHHTRLPRYVRGKRGVIERVLHKDTLVCGNYNQRAFDKLRQLLMMHYSVRDKAVVALGAATRRALNDLGRRKLIADFRETVSAEGAMNMVLTLRPQGLLGEKTS